MTFLLLFIFAVNLVAQKTSFDNIHFTPIEHGTFVMEVPTATIFVDPVGDIKRFSRWGKPGIILITDIHGDHLDTELVKKLKDNNTKIVAPKAVIDKLGMGDILNNGETIEIDSIKIEAIPMYNLTDERSKFHKKGRGNGYVINTAQKRIYISGDTEDIPEMRNLNNIDYAFVCMNLPYTMTVEQAASAVLEFKPKVAIPYHFRGSNGLSDVEKFKQLVSKDTVIETMILKWY